MNATRPDGPPPAAAEAHFRALKPLYASAPVNGPFDSWRSIVAAGETRIDFTVAEEVFRAAGAAHVTPYFKMFDAAFNAANSLVGDRFLLTTAFNLHFTKPLAVGPAHAEGRWISGRRRVFVAEARIVDTEGEECARGTGTFLCSHIGLSGLAGYRVR